MAKVFSRAIPAVLYLAGFASKSDFAGLELAKAVKNFSNGNVVPVLETIAVLTKEQLVLPLNKTGAADLLGKVQRASVGIKSNFKGWGYALALAQLATEQADEGACALISKLAEAEADALKLAYQASKPVKPAKVPAVVGVVEETTEPAPATEPAQETTVIELSTSEIVNLTLDALRAGELSASEIEALRIALSISDEVFPMATQPAPAIHTH